MWPAEDYGIGDRKVKDKDKDKDKDR